MADFIRIVFPDGDANFRWSGGFWPPPDQIAVSGDAAAFLPLLDGMENPDPDVLDTYQRMSYSRLSDEDAEEMTHIARGAVYEKVTT